MRLILLALLISVAALSAPAQIPPTCSHQTELRSSVDPWCAIGYWIQRWFWGPSRRGYPVRRPPEKVRVTVVTDKPVTTLMLAFDPLWSL